MTLSTSCFFKIHNTVMDISTDYSMYLYAFMSKRIYFTGEFKNKHKRGCKCTISVVLFMDKSDIQSLLMHSVLHFNLGHF